MPLGGLNSNPVCILLEWSLWSDNSDHVLFAECRDMLDELHLVRHSIHLGTQLVM